MTSTTADRQDPRPRTGGHAVSHSSPTPYSWLWLLIGAILLLFDGSRNNIALTAWLAPVFMLRFLRVNRTRTALGVTYVVLIATHAIALRGMIPIPVPFYYVFLLVVAAVALLAYLSDRWVAGRIPGFASTLAYPVTLVTICFLNAFGLHGSWGSPAYTQAGNLPLLQLLSVTGLAGVTFLIGWFAAVTNRVWEHGVQSREGLRSAAIFGGVYLAVVLLGGARLALFPPTSKTVRVASLTHADIEPGVTDALADAVMSQKAGAAEVQQFRTRSAATNDELLARSEREARAGARIVFWAEDSAPVLKEDEPALIERGQAVAAANHIYLGMALMTFSPGQPKPVENKLVMITPAGEVAWQYHKTRLTPSFEMTYEVKGDGQLRSLDTPYGRLSGLICFDADFPRFVAQEGSRVHADVVIDPSGDWRAIDPIHTQMASFRAIEQGFNLVRQTRTGLSAAYDYQGHRLAAMDHFKTTDHTLVSLVPVRGTRTIYSRLGDWFAWLCVAGFAAIVLETRRRAAKKMTKRTSGEGGSFIRKLRRA